jgi:hypothetical protein
MSTIRNKAESWRAKTPTLLGTVLAACVLVVAGCGGSPKPLTRAQLLAKGDAICRRLNKRFSSITVKNQQQLIRVLPRLAAYEQQALTELSKLIPPASMENDWKMIVSGAQSVADTTAKLGEAAKAKDVKTTHALLSEIGKMEQRTIAIAKRNGFKACSEAP